MSAKTQPLGQARSCDLVQNCGNPAAAKAENRNGRLREPVAPSASAQLLGQLVRKLPAAQCGYEAHQGSDLAMRLTRPVGHVSTRSVSIVDQLLCGPVIGLLGVPVCQQLEVRCFEIL